MTDRLALVLGAIILAAIALDLLVNDGQVLLFLMVKLADMIEWLSFWR